MARVPFIESGHDDYVQEGVVQAHEEALLPQTGMVPHAHRDGQHKQRLRHFLRLHFDLAHHYEILGRRVRWKPHTLRRVSGGDGHEDFHALAAHEGLICLNKRIRRKAIQFRGSTQIGAHTQRPRARARTHTHAPE
jgi:hypothetical protein